MWSTNAWFRRFMDKKFLLKSLRVVSILLGGIGLTVLGILLIGGKTFPVFAQAEFLPSFNTKSLQGSGGHSDCLSCHSNPKLEGQFLDGEVVSLYFDIESHPESTHMPRCAACHDEQQVYPHEGSVESSCSLCHWQNTDQQEEPQEMLFRLPYPDERAMSLEISNACQKCHVEKFTESDDSVHLKIMEEGNRYAPVCVDCHSSHDIVPGGLTRTTIPMICGKCHLSVYTSYKSSVHGSALENEANTDVPTCGDCHGTHVVKGLDQTSFRVDSITTCGRCHADKALMDKYGISVNVFNTYLNDFHGRTIDYSRKAGNLKVDQATCYDCHGVHNILPPENPSSSVYPANIQGTCQKCHPDAGGAFPQAWLSHKVTGQDDMPILNAIESIYKILIPVVIGGCVFYIGIDVRRRVASELKKRSI